MSKDGAPIGHNSQIEISESRFLSYVAAHGDLEQQIEALNGKRRKLRKSMKADGIRLAEFDAFQKFHLMARADVEDHFRHLEQYLKWGRHPIGTQFSLNLGGGGDDFEDEAAVIARANEGSVEAGFWAGLRNEPMSENPHDEGTDAGQAWIEAWHDGQARRKAEDVDPLDDDDE